MIAKYRGTCRTCGGPIAPGETINWTRARGAQHVDCVRSTINASAEDYQCSDDYRESESEAWSRRQEEGWGPGGY